MHVTEPQPRPTELDDAAVSVAVRSLRDSGLAVIPEAYPLDYIAELHDAYHALLDSRPEGRVQPTSGTHHVQMQVPLVQPFSDVATVAHPFAVQVLTRVLGEKFQCSYYNSNTAYPGSTHQRVHRDSAPIFEDFAVPSPTTGIVVNIPLCDFTEENGSTEVWPASHLIVDTPDDAGVELNERSKALASSRVNVPAGSIVLRDPRVWHRGTPNQSTQERAMLALVYKRSWWGWRAPSLRVPASTMRDWPEHVQQIFAGAPVDPD